MSLGSPEDWPNKPGYPYMALDPSIPSHLSPVAHIVYQDDVVHADGSWRQNYPIYMTTRPTKSSRSSAPTVSLPREATKRRNLPKSHPDDWKSHHRLEVEGEKLELRYIDGKIEYHQTPLTESDKRERLSSTRIGFTTRTKEERRKLGKILRSKGTYLLTAVR
jgi:hypothetical protein